MRRRGSGGARGWEVALLADGGRERLGLERDVELSK